MSKLIIIRGPCGAGKSTVAKALMEQASRPTALVDLDYYRFIFVNPPPEDHNLEYKMAECNILIGLEQGFDVIFEGNFRADSNDPMLERLFKTHPKENYLFYLEASLDETLRRHQNREDRRISADKMRELYEYATPIGHARETVIPETSSLEETIKLIQKTVGI